MIRNQHIGFIFLVVLCFFTREAKCQNGIVGDTLFVNAEAEIGLHFPKMPSTFRTIPSNAPYDFRTLTNGLTVIAKEENTSPAILKISEGGREHQFTLVFKKDINYNTEIDFDYSSTKKIEQRIQQLALARQHTAAPVPVVEKPVLPAVVTPVEKPVTRVEVEKVPEKKPVISTPSTDHAAEYEALTANARILLEQKKYKESRDGYLKALALRPGDLYATYQVEKIEKIIAGEDGSKEKERIAALYKSYLDKANQAFQKGKWAEARVAYEEVLVVKPADPLAATRLLTIDEKEKLQKDQDEKEGEYAALIQQAENSYKAEAYEDAKNSYSKAAVIFKRPLPLEKIKEITALQQRLAAQEKVLAAEREKKELTDAAEKARQEKEAQYASLVKTADDYFLAADYANATTSYNNALLIFKRPWPQDQLKEIAERKTALAIQEKKEKILLSEKLEKERKEAAAKKLEDDYQAAVKEADESFSSGNLEHSKKMYMAALGFIKRPWPQDQIKNIDRKITEQIAAENAEKKRLAKEALTQEKYSKLVADAELAYKKADYTTAKKFYRDALTVKPAEAQPAQMITVIEEIEQRIKAEEKARRDSIALVLDTQKKFNVAIAKGKSNIQKKDLENAREAFKEALSLKPTDSEASIQLQNVEKELAEIARIAEIDRRYDGAVAKADSLLILKNYDEAYNAFTNALAIKPDEYYPKAQANYIMREKETLQKTAEREAALEAKRQLELKYRTAVKNADDAVVRKDFATAVTYYTEASSIHPENDYVNSRLRISLHQANLAKGTVANENAEEGNAKSKKKKNKKTDVAGTTEMPEKSVTDVATPPATDASQKANSENGSGYTDEELRKKYPDVDFSRLPADQPLNKENALNDNDELLNSIYTEKQRLDLKTSTGAVQLICEGITFEENRVYFKYRVKNNSESDFLTGFMMLTWTKKNASNIKLYPLYLYPSSLPVVRPGKEASVIYVAKAYKIMDEDHLKFEMRDRFNKISLQLNISPKVYQQEMSRIPVIGMNQ